MVPRKGVIFFLIILLSWEHETLTYIIDQLSFLHVCLYTLEPTKQERCKINLERKRGMIIQEFIITWWDTVPLAPDLLDPSPISLCLSLSLTCPPLAISSLSIFLFLSLSLYPSLTCLTFSISSLLPLSFSLFFIPHLPTSLNLFSAPNHSHSPFSYLSLSFYFLSRKVKMNTL